MHCTASARPEAGRRLCRARAQRSARGWLAQGSWPVASVGRHGAVLRHARAQVRNLSGGELQRVAITMALGQPANVYLIDEPSAYLDSEQRIVAAKARRPPARPARPWRAGHGRTARP